MISWYYDQVLQNIEFGWVLFTWGPVWGPRCWFRHQARQEEHVCEEKMRNNLWHACFTGSCGRATPSDPRLLGSQKKLWTLTQLTLDGNPQQPHRDQAFLNKGLDNGQWWWLWIWLNAELYSWAKLKVMCYRHQCQGSITNHHHYHHYQHPHCHHIGPILIPSPPMPRSPSPRTLLPSVTTTASTFEHHNVNYDDKEHQQVWLEHDYHCHHWHWDHHCDFE